MALTATAQSAFTPSWDEAIVPSLRKRLETESRMLAKRISTTSISDDDNIANIGNTYRTASSTSSFQHTRERPSTATAYRTDLAPPTRPTQQHSSRPNGTPNAKATPGNRPRTYSQPPIVPTSSSRSNSPMVDRADARPSRIPVVSRGRTPSISSHTQTLTNGSGHLINGVKDSSADLYAVREAAPSPPAIDISLRHKNSRIVNETAPYNSAYASDTDSLPRPSMDSEEHPFEHWYRGDTSRNGGVGELRVGRRMEMLEIANHGYSLRSKAFGSHAPDAGSSSRAQSRADGVVGRRRADSLGARESFYLDDNVDLARVMDERPLTDAEDTDAEQTMRVHTNHPRNDEGSAESRIPRPNRAATPTNQRPLNGRTTTSPVTPQLATPRAGSEPPFGGSAAASPSTPVRAPGSQQQRSRSQPRLLNTPPAASSAKRRASPAPSPGGAAAGKKPKTVAQRRVPREEVNRRSVGSYPDVEDDGDSSLADAIPRWTQPKMTNGNWDDVVLPAVARKKGLDGHYEQADGSPKVIQRRASMQYEPAPGTFGYDHTKYRPPRQDGDYISGDYIPMDEFGQMPQPEPRTDSDDDDRPRQPMVEDHRPIRPKPAQAHLDPPPPDPASPRTPSPAPFAHYLGSRDRVDPAQAYPKVEEPDAASAGCCKCVVM